METRAELSQQKAEIMTLKQDLAQLSHTLRTYMPTVINAFVPQGEDGEDPQKFKKMGVLGFFMGDVKKTVHLNLHVQNQIEGTEGYVVDTISVKTLCFRHGLLIGTIDQVDPDNLTEICVGYESELPEGDFISLRCSNLSSVS